jgi:hypothetical protein
VSGEGLYADLAAAGGAAMVGGEAEVSDVKNGEDEGVQSGLFNHLRGEPMKKPDYCTKIDVRCPSCSLSNYGLDCAQNKIFTLGSLAHAITGGNLPAMAKLLNDAGMIPLVGETKPRAKTFVPRPVVMDLIAIHAGDRVGRIAAELIRQ